MVQSGDSPVDYKNLFNREFINVWMTKMQDAGREAGTIKTYLGSLVHFYNFVVISGDPRFDENDYNKINKMKTVIKVWCKTLWKAIERRKYEKQIEDMKRFPTGEQVCNFDKCDLAKEAINILKAFVADRSLKLNRKSYCLIRDCLIAQVLFDNASRPAAISNMTLGEFKSSVSQNDGIVVRVLHHKNDYKGPANITFQHEVYKRVQMYINFVRQRLPDVNVRDCDPVFLSFNGSKMDSSMITTQFSSFWNRGLGLPIEDRMIPTVVQKYTTTMIHNLNPSAKQDTADVLCHTLRQANETYLCQEKQNKASSSTKVIRATQRITDKNSIDTIVDELFEKEIKDKNIKITKSLVDEKLYCDERFSEIVNQPTKSKQVLDSVRYKKVKFEQRENQEVQTNENNIYYENNFKEIYEKRQRKDYTSSEVDAIYMYLGDYIYSQCKIERVVFENYVRGIPEFEFVFKKFGINSLITKIRTERKSPRPKNI
ncbi:uncharacterized protein LOC124809068 [Hydra vulgaris]|uniref:uncharacterized protein LOC124809068 n=1 Tax=Hydra vulgaris TaxID=6087 RepID=UPI0032EA7ADF